MNNIFEIDLPLNNPTPTINGDGIQERNAYYKSLIYIKKWIQKFVRKKNVHLFQFKHFCWVAIIAA